jgi:hypothetical protein
VEQEAERRSIALPTLVVAALRSQCASQNARRLHAGAAWHDDDLVFDRGDGSVLHPNIVTHGFPRAVKRLTPGQPETPGCPAGDARETRLTCSRVQPSNGWPPAAGAERPFIELALEACHRDVVRAAGAV